MASSFQAADVQTQKFNSQMQVWPRPPPPTVFQAGEWPAGGGGKRAGKFSKVPDKQERLAWNGEVTLGEGERKEREAEVISGAKAQKTETGVIW